MRPCEAKCCVLIVAMFVGDAVYGPAALAQPPRDSTAGVAQVKRAGDGQFAKQIRPLLVKYCVECHKVGNMPGLDFLAAKTESDFDPLRHVYVNVVRAMEGRTMPPPDFDQPSDAERKLLTSWLRTKLKTTTPPGEPVIPDVTRQISKYAIEIYEDRKGNLWFGTMQMGAVCYDRKSLRYFTKKDGLPGGGVTSFAEDKDGNLWIGTQEGICRYDGKTIKRFGEAEGLMPLKDRKSPFPPGGGSVYADKDRNIWANMLSGVFRFNGKTFSEYKLPINKNEIASHGVVPGSASLTLEDSGGNLWFKTDGYGALKFDGKSFTRFTKKDGLCSNNVNGILEDKQGNIWFACMQSHQPRQTGDGGVCRFDGKTFTTFPDVKGLHNNDIYTIYQDRSGNIWIGATRHGVYRYDGKSFRLFNRTNRMDLTWALGLQAAHEARNGTLWLGFSGGLFRFNGTSIINVTKDGPWEGVAIALSKAVGPDATQPKWLHATTRTALSDLSKGDVQKARLALQQLKRDEPEEISIQDHSINQLGYQLMHNKRVDLAIEIFKINTELYPEISNTFDSLGEAYLRKGDEKLAIANYKRSLELEPGNTAAARTIREIVGRQKYEKRLVAPKGWMEEVIALPPGFAPAMSFRGLEHLRLPPEFRKPDSDWFMSYLFALDLSERAELTEESIGSQLLIYFQGLATGGRDKAGNEIDTTKFSIEPRKLKGREDGEFVYTLNWREPFVNATSLKQNLRVKVIRGRNKHGLIFVCGSPKPFESNVWTELLRIRTTFATAPVERTSVSIEQRRSRHSMQAPPEEQQRIRDKQRATGYGGGDIVAAGIMDRKGDLWFCSSNDGVYRYDGRTFTNFSKKDGLNSNKLWSVVEARDGKLWFGTADGLCSYDGKMFTHVPIPGADDAKLVLSLLEDRRGNLWIGTLGGGAYRYDGKTFTSFLKNAGRIQPNGRHYNVIQSMTEDSAGSIWFTSQTHGGVSRYDGKKLTHFNQKDGLSDDMIFASFADKSGNMWFGTRDNGVCRFDGKSFTTFTTANGLRSRMVSCFYQDNTGKLWLGSFARSGVCCFDGKTFTNFPPKGGQELIDTRFIMADKNDHLWFGGRFGLLARFDGKKITDFTKSKRQPNLSR
ncbi:MAG: two-component regulator propeller domain-containing protein [Planctomycetaceae bacterium]